MTVNDYGYQVNDSFGENLMAAIKGVGGQSYKYKRGEPGKGMGGWQDASGEGGIGAGIEGMWWGSNMNKLKHAGKDLRATAMYWVPQLLETTPEAKTLFNEEEYLEMMRPQLEQSINQMMGGYRTSTENIRRGLAARGLSASGLAQGIGADVSGELRGQAAGMESSTMAEARMNRLQQALQYRQRSTALGLQVPQPAHQVQNDSGGSPWGAIAGAAAGSLLGSFTGGVGSNLAGAMF